MAAPAALASPDQEAAFRNSVAQLRVIQQALAQGRLADAKAACSAVLQRKEVPAHHRWEAQEPLTEIERLEKGLPARDPSAHRIALP
jgi:hypothetical protein